MHRRLTPLLFAMAILLAPAARAGTVLDRVRGAGVVHCGLIGEQELYGKTDIHGSLTDIGHELCRAVAVAVLPSAAGTIQVDTYPDEAHAYAALAQGRVDVAIGLTPTLLDAARRHVAFTTPFFLDGVTLMVRHDGPVHAVADLRGHQLCFLDNTHGEDVLLHRIDARSGYIPFPFEEEGEEQAALVTGHCAAMIGAMSQLAAGRANFHALRYAYDILPDLLSIDPAAAATDAADPEWARVVQATLAMEISAWNSGIDAASVAADPKAPALDHLDRVGGPLGLDPAWATRTLGAVGNWGEVLARTTGPHSDMNLPAGPNRPWSQGGLIVPPILD